MQWFDMRSDTVAQPTHAVREATAVVGDDVYGDDPTVTQLETLAANMLGKEAALFVPTGNFGNQLAIFTQCRRGDDVIVGVDSHNVWHENGTAAVIAGVQLHTIASNRDELGSADIQARIRIGTDIHIPSTGLICLESAHSNGRVILIETTAATAEIARSHEIPVHLDGGRVFNAAAYLGCDVRKISWHVDTVMCCLPRGLAAPVGSILPGPSEFIVKAMYMYHDQSRRRSNRTGAGTLEGGGMAYASPDHGRRILIGLHRFAALVRESLEAAVRYHYAAPWSENISTPVVNTAEHGSTCHLSALPARATI